MPAATVPNKGIGGHQVLLRDDEEGRVMVAGQRDAGTPTSRRRPAEVRQEAPATPREERSARHQRVLEQFFATYPAILHRVREAVTLVDEGRVAVFRSGPLVGAVILATGSEGPQARYTIVQHEHCPCTERRAGPAHPCVHLLALELVAALAQEAAAPSA
jgi:hypothetical protein